MFNECVSLLSLDLSNFDASNANDMSFMFNECVLLNSINLNNFNTSKVTNMSHMFNYCKSLISIDLTSFDTTNVINMSHMFNYCCSLINIGIFKFETKNVNSMFFMFSFCVSLKKIDLSKFYIKDISKMLYMFNCCKSLQLINLKNLDLGNGKLTDLIFKNISGDCEIICRDKIGLKKEIVKNDIVDYNNTFFLNNYYRNMRRLKMLSYQEKEELQNIKISTSKFIINLFFITVTLIGNCAGKTSLIRT